MSNSYEVFKDHEKYLILIYLVKKTFDFYATSLIKLSWDQFFSLKNIELGKFNIIDISADTFKLLNVSPGHEQDILDAYLDGVCETLGKDNMTAYEDCKAQLATMPYIGDGYWDYDHTYFDNSQKTYPVADPRSHAEPCSQ